jgi:hypothetical protein
MVRIRHLGFTEYKVVRRWCLLTAGSPRIDGRNAALPRAATSNRRGPDPPQRDTVLAAVKAWPTEPGVCAFDGATASLDGGCARRHGATAGRDEETVLRSNKETDQKETTMER